MLVGYFAYVKSHLVFGVMEGIVVNVAIFILIISVIIVHWVADFVCQTDEMAVNKSKSWYWLGYHVCVYTSILFLGMVVCLSFLVGFEKFLTEPSIITGLFVFAVINGVLHFITDAITSRVSSHLWQKGDRHNFFVMVGFDQVIHYTCLFGVITCGAWMNGF